MLSISAMLSLLTLIITPQLAAAAPFSAGYSHGCDDGKLGFHKYLNTPGKGIDEHTPEFMQGYDNGYKGCFSPNGSASDSSKTHSQSANTDTGDTLVSCNKSEHTTEYCNGYRAGAVQADIDDDPDENITPSKVTCEGIVVLVHSTVQDINKGLQMRNVQCFLLTRLT